jgi:phospholipase/lecithinase/hemolysin
MRKRLILALCSALALCLVGARDVLAGPYDTIYSFGDSLTDEGNTLTLARSGRVPGLLAQPLPPYYAGRSSNGPVWIEYLAPSLGVGAPTASLLGGTNFAYAGAETGTTPLHVANPLDLLGPQGQFAQFRQAVPQPSPGALYTVWIGANDLYENFYALGAGRSADLAASADAAARNAAEFVREIVGAGARNILLVTVPDIGLSPIITQTYPAYVDAASALARSYNSELVGLVSEIAAQNSVNLDVFDTYSLLQRAVLDPGQFGLQNATDPCWTGDFVGQNGTVCADPSSYLFWDHYHPTTAAHRQIAAQAFATLVDVPEPGSGAVLAVGGLLTIWVSRRRPVGQPQKWIARP